MFVVILFMMFFMVIFLFHTVYLIMTNSSSSKKKKNSEHLIKKPTGNYVIKRKHKQSLTLKETQSRIQTLHKKIKSQQKRIKNSKHISSNTLKHLRKLQKHQDNLAYLELNQTNREKCNFCS